MSIRWSIIIVGVATLILVVFLRSPAPETHDYWVIGGEAHHVLVADDTHSRQRGLSGLPSLDADSVMLFIFPEEGLHGIWMKDMAFAIDIVWLDQGRRIVHIEENVTPDTYPRVYQPTQESRFVVEMNEGSVHRLGLQLKQQLEAWPSG